ncbi:hypothetical protein TIFTF001_017346 [Ficus carica]|uniref:Uncharacterized protein n=1 Tax=Ficus carica TaxID=3494 RepID=A0AA88AC21_FICCA|nr:hypothetical protein TIFTF001_017346 [Ficus carica]
MLRNTTKKASDNCLNESIIPDISLRYHYRAVQVLISVHEAIIMVGILNLTGEAKGVETDSSGFDLDRVARLLRLLEGS